MPVASRERLDGPDGPGRPGRLAFEFDDRHQWRLWYRGEGAPVPLLPFTSAGIHLGDRTLTLGELDDVSLQAGAPPSGESTVIRGRAAGLFVEATFQVEPPAPAPRASLTLRIYPDTDLPAVSGMAWASLPLARTLPGAGELLAHVDESIPAILPVTASTPPDIRSAGMLALTRRINGAVRALAIIEEPGGAGSLSAVATSGALTLDTFWTPPRPVSPGGDDQTVTFCYQPQGDGLAALSAACAPAQGDRDFLASLVPPAGLWLAGSQGRGEDLFDLLGRAALLLDPRFAPMIAYGPGDAGPRGHRWCTDQIHAAGLLAAVSLTPFSAGDGTRLDPAHPETQTALRKRARVAVQEWGYDALILHDVDSVFQIAQHQGNLTHLEALRAGLGAIHEGAGPVTIWSAAVVPQTGTLRVVRVGDPPSPGFSAVAEMNSRAGLRSFYHRSWWLNDPGPITLGYPLTLVEARTQLSLAALTGAATTFTADVLDVPDAQVDLVQRAVPPAPVAGHPLGGSGSPSLWVARSGDWLTVLMINWNDSQDDERILRLADVGLSAGAYVAYDVWSGTPLPAADPFHFTLEPHDCRVLGVRPRANHPQVIGTTRHVIQGAVDLRDEHWDAG
ncbi:MAG TPA: hypothetical protein VNX15_00865, partial [Gemmatimonadales bacterium]|nr:hypothetical protein [Gemmatimonadales bacterium]